MLKESAIAIPDPKKMSFNNFVINESLGAAVGAGVGGGVSFAALFFGDNYFGLSAPGITSAVAMAGGLFGGGEALGVAVLSIPVVVFAVGGYFVVSAQRNSKLAKKKVLLLQEAQRKQNAIALELQRVDRENQGQIEHLTQLNYVLREIITNMEFELDKSQDAPECL